jgi:4-amino-4-deoxy-L-arabinose transferase-like glycosyltransferase
MLIIVTNSVRFPRALNPDFFNYGTLPIYLLRGSAQLLESLSRSYASFANYDGLLTLGRTLSSVFDVGTVALIFLAAYQLTRKKATALLSSILYSLAFFPIQNSHFFVVDVFLTFFVTALVTSLIWYAHTRRTLAIRVMGICMGAAIATKFTAIVFMPGIIVALGIIQYCFSPTERVTRRIPMIFALVSPIIAFCLTSVLFFALFMPYAILPPSGILSLPQNTIANGESADMFRSFPGMNDIVHFLDPNRAMETRFLHDVRDQMRMNSDAYVFPYTLQYVTTKPYIYHIEQIFWWGLGPFIGILTIIGVIFLLQQLVHVLKKRKGTDLVMVSADSVEHSRYNRNLSNHESTKYGNISSLILVSCLMIIFGLYFLIIGRSAVKFMRYMLPLYPMLAITAGYGLSKLIHRSFVPSHTITVMMGYKALVAIFLMGTLVWSLTFLGIYSQRHTRIVATDWILANIPPGKTLAVEHWDDRVPIRYGEQYQYQEMTIYELPDDEKKWEMLMKKLRQSDYVILASNRLYTPLPKLADCSKFKVCYPLATKYYEKLFDGSLGFRKIKEFTAYPHFGPWQINDDSADESFSVYEHPKVIVFKK